MPASARVRASFSARCLPISLNSASAASDTFSAWRTSRMVCAKPALQENASARYRNTAINRANLFVTLIGKNEIDGGGYLFAVDAEQLVRCAVGRGRMGRHAEAVGNGFEMFLLFVDAMPSPPPPGLMDEGAMRRIHQADD